MIDQPWQTILTRIEDGVGWVSLNRPERFNAFVTVMGDELLSAFHQFNALAEVKAVVLTGVGRGFCAGLDRSLHDDPPALQAFGASPFLREFAPLIRAYRKPTVVAVNGAAAGIGVTACLGFDQLIMARSARLVMPFAAMKIAPGMGATYHLPRRVGLAWANRLLMRGESIDAATAHRIGLASEVVDDETLPTAAQQLAAQLAQLAPGVVSELRAALAYGAGNSFAATLAREQLTAKLSLAGAYPPADEADLMPELSQ